MLREEEMSQLFEHLLQIAEAGSQRLRDAQAQQGQSPGDSSDADVPFRARTLPETRERFLRNLSSEIVPAVSAGPEGIRAEEIETEVLTKALMAVRHVDLRRLAEDNDLRPQGTHEQLAARIVGHFRSDAGRIADLVLGYRSEPDDSHSHVDRLFPLSAPVDLVESATALEYVLGRYIRIGVARWFAFDTLAVGDGVLALGGSVRTFTPEITRTGGQARVVPISRTEHELVVRLHQSDPVVVVQAGSISDSRAAVLAVSAVLQDLDPLGRVAGKLHHQVADAQFSMHEHTVFMLDLLYSRLDTAALHGRNLTAARFSLERREADADEEGRRPRLRAVSYEGDHLLDSPEACRLIDGGKPLVGVSITLSRSDQVQAEVVRCPVRVSIERDHVAVVTGLGSVPSRAIEIHDLVVSAVKDEIELGILDSDVLAQFLARVAARARAESAPDVADMLTDF